MTWDSRRTSKNAEILREPQRRQLWRPAAKLRCKWHRQELEIVGRGPGYRHFLERSRRHRIRVPAQRKIIPLLLFRLRFSPSTFFLQLLSLTTGQIRLLRQTWQAELGASLARRLPFGVRYPDDTIVRTGPSNARPFSARTFLARRYCARGCHSIGDAIDRRRTPRQRLATNTHGQGFAANSICFVIGSNRMHAHRGGG